MPVSYSYNSSKEALYGKMTGELSIEEYRSITEEIVSSASYPPNIRTIWDFRGLDFSTITRDFVHALRNVRAAFPKRRAARIAFVVNGDLGFGVTRMFETVCDELDDTSMVFRNFSEAEEWLFQKK